MSKAALLLLLAVATGLGAQKTDLKVSAPFVSRLAHAKVSADYADDAD